MFSALNLSGTEFQEPSVQFTVLLLDSALQVRKLEKLSLFSFFLPGNGKNGKSM
jgi:hypothetical protein